jgi:methionyl-tRNA formyltransferase
MKIVFMGTPEFAAVSLKSLFDSEHEVIAVVTQPDKPVGRGKKITFSPVKTLVQSRCPVYQPDTLRESGIIGKIAELSPDIIVAVAYGKLLPAEIIELPKYGCINIHGSLLPRYRGAAPIQRAVLNGEKITGVTSMYISERMDEGDIISQKETEIGESETSGELFERLAVLGAELLTETLTAIENKTAGRTPQNHAEATYAPPLTKELSPIDRGRTTEEILNQIRGLLPWPVATATFGGIVFKIFAAEKGAGDGIQLACADGEITLTEISAPGGKRMAAADYLRGHPLQCI